LTIRSGKRGYGPAPDQTIFEASFRVHLCSRRVLSGRAGNRSTPRSNVFDAIAAEPAGRSPIAGKADEIAATKMTEIDRAVPPAVGANHIDGNETTALFLTQDQQVVPVIDSFDYSANQPGDLPSALGYGRIGRPVDDVDVDDAAAKQAGEADRSSDPKFAGMTPKGTFGNPERLASTIQFDPIPVAFAANGANPPLDRDSFIVAMAAVVSLTPRRPLSGCPIRDESSEEYGETNGSSELKSRSSYPVHFILLNGPSTRSCLPI